MHRSTRSSRSGTRCKPRYSPRAGAGRLECDWAWMRASVLSSIASGFLQSNRRADATIPSSQALSPRHG
jgi:hypothetical protein